MKTFSNLPFPRCLLARLAPSSRCTYSFVDVIATTNYPMELLLFPSRWLSQSELVPWVSAESNSQRHCAPLMPARHFCCLWFVPLSPSPSITGEYRDDNDTICVIEGSSVTVPRKRRLPPQRRFGPMGRTSVSREPRGGQPASGCARACPAL